MPPKVNHRSCSWAADCPSLWLQLLPVLPDSLYMVTSSVQRTCMRQRPRRYGISPCRSAETWCSVCTKVCWIWICQEPKNCRRSAATYRVPSQASTIPEASVMCRYGGEHSVVCVHKLVQYILRRYGSETRRYRKIMDYDTMRYVPPSVYCTILIGLL